MKFSIYTLLRLINKQCQKRLKFVDGTLYKRNRIFYIPTKLPINEEDRLRYIIDLLPYQLRTEFLIQPVDMQKKIVRNLDIIKLLHNK